MTRLPSRAVSFCLRCAASNSPPATSIPRTATVMAPRHPACSVCASNQATSRGYRSTHGGFANRRSNIPCCLIYLQRAASLCLYLVARVHRAEYGPRSAWHARYTELDWEARSGLASRGVSPSENRRQPSVPNVRPYDSTTSHSQ